MSTYTASRSELIAALANALDFDRAPNAEYSTFGDFADAILSRLTCHEVTRPGKTVRADDEIRELVASRLTADVLARCHEAGRGLGQKLTDHRGNPTGPVPPSPSRRAKLRML